jgi:hypothetical protein
VITVAVHDSGGAGGFHGSPDQLYLEFARAGQAPLRIALDGAWRAAAVGAPKSRHPRPRTLSPSTPAALYNGLIAPLAPFRFSGAIWYQGESNRYDPALYRETFSAAFRDQVSPELWREWMQWQRERLGACRFDRMLDVHGPHHGDWLSRCDKGFRRFSMRMSNAGGPQFDALNGHEIHPPQAALAALEKVLAADDRDRSCRRVASQIDCDAFYREMDRAAVDGPCQLGAVVDGHPSWVASELTCAARQLTLWTRAKDESLTAFSLRERHGPTRCDP